MHTWASFGWTTKTIQPSFSGVMVVGAANPSTIPLGTIPVISQVGLDDGSHYTFEYNSAGQVNPIRSYRSDNVQRTYTAYDYDSPADDCPRLIDTHTWAENWTGINGVPQEVATLFGAPGDGSHTVTAPDGTTYKEFYGTGWQRGLTTQTEVWSGGVRQKWTTNTWTQDNTGVNYQTNPRVTETNVFDASGNRRRTTVSYAPAFVLPNGASCSLPRDTHEYAGDAGTMLRRTHIDYRMDPTLDATYLDRHIIGSVKEQSLYEINGGTETLMSRVGFGYDEANSIQGTDAPVRHDNENYSATFLTGRANLTSVKRYDVSDTSQFTISSMKYNTAGSVVDATDPLSHHTTLSYADSFSDGNNGRNTLAYPKVVTDADGYSSTLIYNFDFGALTSKQTPQPNTTQNLPGPVQTLAYDAAGRVERVTSTSNSAYVRYVYGPNYLLILSTVNNVADEAYSSTVFDGLGRTVVSATNHPGIIEGRYSAVNTIYDSMGRAVKSSNPTETSSAWFPAGDDVAGWLYTQQTYDWKGRPLVTTNTDGTTREASYAGCGCAGGEVVTLADEGTIDGGVPKRRLQKIYSDVLGRTVKSEILNWQGGTPYATSINNYNTRDQITRSRQFDAAQGTVPSDPNDLSCPTGSCQQTTMTYDGYGRLKTKHVPERDENTVTTYNYNADDTSSSVVDARGSSSTFTYNARRLVTHIAYEPSAGVPDTPDVSFTYDAAGKRTSMSDGLGSVSYVYDQLSRLTSESRNFTGVGTFPLNYAYNLANELTSINDQTFNTTMGYNYDLAGRLSGVTGSGYPSVSQFASNMQYRAWGGLKSMSYGNGKTLSMGYNSRLMPSSYSVPGTISKTYQYYADGRMDYSQDLGDPRYDRKSRYDQVGSLTSALSGAEARGLPATDDRPYNQTYQHDIWGNMTNRTGKQWARPEASEPATYSNNRRSGWNYDASGNWLDEGTFNALQRKYDAAGRLARIEHPAFPNNPKRTDDYDGDGQRLRSGYHQLGCSPEYTCPFEYTYYLNSTVLGGRVVTEIRGNGQKAMGYVYYPSGGVIAVQKLATPEDVAAYVLWRHNDPANVSVRATDTNGSVNGYLQGRYNAELDPVGADNALEDPGEMQLYTPDDFSPAWLLPSKPMGRCKLDGIPIDCDWAMEMLSSGSAVQCPNNDCGTVQAPFTAYGDGWSGYLPAGVSYTGDGFVLGSIWTGGAPEKISFDDLGFGSLAEGLAASFTSGKPDKKNRRKRPETPSIHVVDFMTWINERLKIEHFTPARESWIRYELQSLLTLKCSQAFPKGVTSPITTIGERGVVIRPAEDLQHYSATQLGLSEESYRDSNNKAFTGQGGTVFGTDGRAQIYLNDTAFWGPNWIGTNQSLGDVLRHEFIHAGGQGPWPATAFGKRRHDLAGFPAYKNIMQACR